MARKTRQYGLLLVGAVLLAALAAVSVVSAAEQAASAPTFADRFEDAKKLSREQAAKFKGHLDTWTEWALKTSGEWSEKGKEKANQGYGAKAAEALKSSTVQTHQHVTDTVSKWSNWAKDAANKYAGIGKAKVGNPAAEAAKFINNNIPGSTDSKDDEL